MSRVIIDTDPGVDDSVAILLALSNSKAQVDALTIVHGNSNDVVKLANNACTVLEIAGRPDIPVFIGSALPLSNKEGLGAEFVHGNNCLGDIELPHIKHQPHPHQHAVEFIVSHVKQHPKEVVIIALGPLTNIALALQLYPGLAENVKDIFIMGGAINVPGNASPVAEANIYDDPEAAKIVFNAKWPNPISVTALDLSTRVRANHSFFTPLRDSNKASGKFTYDILKFYQDCHTNIFKNPDMPVHDGTSVMSFLYPELFEGYLTHIEIETEGKWTRGMTVSFGRKYQCFPEVTGARNNARVLSCVNIDKLKQLIIEQLLSLP